MCPSPTCKKTIKIPKFRKPNNPMPPMNWTNLLNKSWEK